jgi:uncharacterized protein (DUF58 family)
MIPKEILKQIKRIEITTKRLVSETFGGEYTSVFKGQGIEFADVREYVPGDEIRSIDWNVTARFGHPYIKIFEEERELTVMLLVDMSGSLMFGSVEKTKQQVAAELSAVLAFSALKNNDKVGLILFTDRIEKFVPPRKGKSHSLRIIREVLSFEPEGNQTNLRQALEYFNHTIKKKAIVFLISDFIDGGYEKILRIVGKKHDLIGIVLRDQREKSMIDAGLIKFRDGETGEIRFIDTGDKIIRQSVIDENNHWAEFRRQLFVSSRLDSINIETSGSYVKPLVDFFKLREKRW